MNGHFGRPILSPMFPIPCVDVRIFGRIPKLRLRKHTACLIADIRMPGISGLELQAKLNEAHQRIPIIFITAQGDEKLRLQALEQAQWNF